MLKMGHSRTLFFILIFSIVYSVHVDYNISTKIGSELQTSGIRSDCFAN